MPPQNPQPPPAPKPPETAPPNSPSPGSTSGARLLVSRVRLATLPGDADRGIPASRDTFAVPTRQHPDDAGLDLTAAHFLTIQPHATARLRHNLAIALPEKTFGMIVPRSSTLPNKGLIVLPGVLDPGFRGEVQTVLYNPGRFVVQVHEGERLSQLLVFRSAAFAVEVVTTLPDSERGEAGFGSTGGMLGSSRKETPSAT